MKVTGFIRVMYLRGAERVDMPLFTAVSKYIIFFLQY